MSSPTMLAVLVSPGTLLLWDAKGKLALLFTQAHVVRLSACSACLACHTAPKPQSPWCVCLPTVPVCPASRAPTLHARH